MPGDEIIAINGRRTDSNKKLNSSLKGQNEKIANIIYSHEGVVKSADVKMINKIQHKVKLEGTSVVLATAHPSKFPYAINKAINVNPNLPDKLKHILDEKENYNIISNNLKKIKKYIIDQLK